MSKRKKKQRKNKMARPPKRSKPQTHLPPMPHTQQASNASGLSEAIEWEETHDDSPSGIHPSMYKSLRYKNFVANCATIASALPEGSKTFASYDVSDAKLRRWLNHHALRKEQAEIRGWQIEELEKIGFNWKHGRKPAPKKAKKKRKVKVAKVPAKKKAKKEKKPKEKSAWLRKLDRIKAIVADTQTLPMLQIIRADDVHFHWLNVQLIRIRSKILPPRLREPLDALPFDIEALAQSKRLSIWRRSFRQFLAIDAPSTETQIVAKKRAISVERWARSQRKLQQTSKLEPWKHSVLEAVNFDWTPPKKKNYHSQEEIEARWAEKFKKLRDLESEYGKPLPINALKSNGLCPWQARMREHYVAGRLRPELIANYKAQGFEFEAAAARQRALHKTWDRQYKKLLAFKKRFGHVRVPASYAEDVELGRWLHRQRVRMTTGYLDVKQEKAFRDIGICNVHEETKANNKQVQVTHISAWMRGYNELVKYLKKEHGGTLPAEAKFPQKWKNWLKRQCAHLEAQKLNPWQIEALDAIGFDPDSLPKPLPGPAPSEIWKENIQNLNAYVAKHGHSQAGRGSSNHKLHLFTTRTRKQFNAGELSEEQIAELKAAKFLFRPKQTPTPAWLRNHAGLIAYHKKHGHSDVPRVHSLDQALAEHVAQTKQRARKGKLLAEHIQLLDAINFQWSNGEHPTPKEEI